ncbi:MAG TPA: hypothetical protein VMU82_05645 [Acetobacteraceae bacterium]|nr:hypothetical protein [Acetobacteraceae bacterium]
MNGTSARRKVALTGMAVLLVGALAAPALAQPYGPPGYGPQRGDHFRRPPPRRWNYNRYPGVVYAPPQQFYAPPTVYYPPPPAYYSAPAPGLSLNFLFPLGN